MNKSDLIGNLEGKLKNLSRKEIEVIVDTVFDRMTHALSDGGRIEIRGFGSFEVRTRDPRQGRNPKTGVSVYVGTRKVPFFKVGKELRERVNHGISPSSEESMV
ncbi:MAG TPA: integration host factor subunit beta [Deltaproteobacteria bacterium]|nr:MAG: integration host factor subunit beta [Deltaproteobacteria bacterium GWA2_45_12]HBF13416.1 integration host factor subunit beta [Deltaproteobacteria bacterium]